MTYCVLDDVKTRLSSDDITMSGDWDDVLTAKCGEVTEDIDRMVRQARGNHGPFSFLADSSATARVFYSRGGRILPIDDCVAITGVTVRDYGVTTGTALALTSQYMLEPPSGTPIVSIWRVDGSWPEGAFVEVTAKWGYAVTLPTDVREAAIIEVIRSYFADRAGNDDRLGLTPFGQLITSKAFTSKVGKLVNDYSYGGGSLR